MGSGNKSQRIKKGPWSLGERERQGKRAGGREWGKVQACSIKIAAKVVILLTAYITNYWTVCTF